LPSISWWISLMVLMPFQNEAPAREIPQEIKRLLRVGAYQEYPSSSSRSSSIPK